jgi:hypothetical protein
MRWWMWVLLAWVLLSLPIAIGVGRFIRGPAREQQPRGFLLDRHDLDVPPPKLPQQWRDEESA